MPVELDADDAPLPTLRASPAARHVVQEALTNAARHGRGAAVRVRVRRGEDGTEIVVASGAAVATGSSGRGTGLAERVRHDDATKNTVTSGRFPATASPSRGTGLASLANRAQALGGEFSARHDGDGFTVRALLPHAPAAESDPTPPQQEEPMVRAGVCVVLSSAPDVEIVAEAPDGHTAV